MNHESLAQFLPSSVGASDSAHVSNAGQQRAQDKFQIALRILSCVLRSDTSTWYLSK